VSPKLEGSLVKQYPKLFARINLGPKESCMHWGIAVPDGWERVVARLCARIAQVCKDYPVTSAEFEQIKTKFGQLRVYIDVEGSREARDLIGKIVLESEIESLHICQTCGEWMDEITKVSHCDTCAHTL
jgi:hypothetical protein